MDKNLIKLEIYKAEYEESKEGYKYIYWILFPLALTFLLGNLSLVASWLSSPLVLIVNLFSGNLKILVGFVIIIIGVPLYLIFIAWGAIKLLNKIDNRQRRAYEKYINNLNILLNKKKTRSK